RPCIAPNRRRLGGERSPHWPNRSRWDFGPSSNGGSMRLFVVAWMVVAFSTVCCRVARAGTYDVWGCRLPDGRSAPINGWQATPFGSFQSTCASGGLLETQLDYTADVPYYAAEGWFFRAPVDTTIDNLTMRRAVAVSGYREYHLYREFTGGMTWPPA